MSLHVHVWIMSIESQDRHGRHLNVVRFTTTYAISAYHH
jgi:hypothetical protein